MDALCKIYFVFFKESHFSQSVSSHLNCQMDRSLGTHRKGQKYSIRSADELFTHPTATFLLDYFFSMDQSGRVEKCHLQ